MNNRVVRTVGLLLATLAGLANADPGERIRIGGGVLSAPSGDWIREAAPGGESVEFTRLYKWLGQTKGMTQIIVFRNAVSPEVPDGPELIASSFLAGEERIMREQGVAAGEYELSQLKRGERMLAGRKLFTLDYRKKLSVLRHGRKAEDAQLNLWFPDDFAQTREFYGFLVSELREKGAMVAKPDLSQIDPVILSFQLER